MPNPKNKKQDRSIPQDFKGAEELNLNTEFVVWDAEGETIQGEFDGIEEIDGKFGQQPYWRIIDKEDTVKLIVETVMLSRARRKIKIGETVAVMYDGEIESSKGNPVKQYRVFRLNPRG